MLAEIDDLLRTFSSRPNGEELLFSEIERRFGASDVRAHAMANRPATTQQEADKIEFGLASTDRNYDHTSGEKEAQSKLETAMGAASADSEKREKIAKEFETKGAELLRGLNLLVQLPLENDPGG